MASCDTLIEILHNIVDTLPVTHDIPNMVSLLQSLVNIVNTYLGQCFPIYSV